MNAISKSREWPPDGQAPTGPTPVALRAPSVDPVEKNITAVKTTTGSELNRTGKLSEQGGPPNSCYAEIRSRLLPYYSTVSAS